MNVTVILSNQPTNEASPTVENLLNLTQLDKFGRNLLKPNWNEGLRLRILVQVIRHGWRGRG